MKAATNAQLRVRSYHVWRGNGWRVQLHVFDYMTYPLGWSRGAEARRSVTFCVKALPASAKKSVTFSSGEHLYYGRDFNAALNVAAKRLEKVPDTLHLPAFMHDYWLTPVWPEIECD